MQTVGNHFNENIFRMSNYDHLLDRIKAFSLDYFRGQSDKIYVYHNVRHTRDVVKAVRTITGFYKITEADYFIVVASAWFHDLGYYIDAAHHEEKGADLAAKFLTDENVDEQIIEQVKGCIMATKLPQQPHSLLEEIICDADLFHFGTKEFCKRTSLMLEEYNNLHDNSMSKAMWRDKTVAMMESHHYFTDYGLLYLTRTKEKNIKNIKHKEYHNQIATNNMEHKHKPKLQVEADKAKPKEGPERGAETMFKISSNNHSRLSQMADNKAHILITVNSIILSAVISLLLRKLSSNAFLVVPSFILLSVSVTTIVFAILATRPNIPKGTFTPNDIAERKANLLFFGNFFKMDLDAYQSAILEIIHDREFLFDNLIRDVYSQGVVLGRKYQLLRVSYNIFMFGLIAAVAAFIIASCIPHSNAQALPVLDSIPKISHHLK